jgi:hypothetical protein
MWEGNPLLHAAIDARIKGIPGITFIRGAATAEPGNITYRVNHNNAEGSSIGVVEPHPLLTYTTVPGKFCVCISVCVCVRVRSCVVFVYVCVYLLVICVCVHVCSCVMYACMCACVCK